MAKSKSEKKETFFLFFNKRLKIKEVACVYFSTPLMKG
jgi:hypothetical protein